MIYIKELNELKGRFTGMSGILRSQSNYISLEWRMKYWVPVESYYYDCFGHSLGIPVDGCV